MMECLSGRTRRGDSSLELYRQPRGLEQINVKSAARSRQGTVKKTCSYGDAVKCKRLSCKVMDIPCLLAADDASPMRLGGAGARLGIGPEF